MSVTAEERERRQPLPVLDVITLLHRALVFGTWAVDTEAAQCHLAAVFHSARRLDQSEAELQQLKERAHQLYEYHLVQRRDRSTNISVRRSENECRS